MAPGDRMYLSKDCMITWEQAEWDLVAKQANIDKLQERHCQKSQHHAAADDNKEDNNGDEELPALSDRGSPLRNIFTNLLDDSESLSANNNNTTTLTGFYNTLPQGGAS